MNSVDILKLQTEVDWRELRDRLGQASAVPKLLGDARSAVDQRERDNAWAELWDRLCRDGQRFSASAEVVPHLAAYALDASAPDRDRAVKLLLEIAVGYPEDYVGGPWTLAELQEIVEESAGYEELMRWPAACYMAAARVVPALLPLLGESSEKLRAVTAFVSPFFLDQRETWSVALRARWQLEQHPEVRAGLAPALFFVSAIAEAELRSLMVDEKEDELLRVACAAALVRTRRRQKEEDPGEARAVLDTVTKELRMSGDFPWRKLIYAEAKL